MTWNQLPDGVRGWIAIVGFVSGLTGGAFALGAATSGTVSGMRDLPARAAVLEGQVDTLRTTSAYLMRVDSQRVSVWRDVSQIADDVAETRCYVRAMARQRDPMADCSALMNERGR